MFDFEIGTDVFLLILAALFLLLQVFLCAKTNKLWLRLLPTLFLTVLAVVFSVFVFLSEGWDSVGFLFLALGCAFLLLVCGVGWVLWAVAKLVRASKAKKPQGAE